MLFSCLHDKAVQFQSSKQKVLRKTVAEALCCCVYSKNMIQSGSGQ